MINLNLRSHPDVLFGYSANHVELIFRVENPETHAVWAESDISVPEQLSLNPTGSLRKGRIRIGIIEPKEFLEKAVRVYGNSITSPQMYKCNSVTFIFNRDGVIESRLEKSINVRCELKKEASL